MSKNKVIASVGVICIITGIVGGTWSGIKAIPKFIDNLQEVEHQDKQALNIYNKEEKINKLVVNAKRSDVIIKRHNEPTVKVEMVGNKKDSKVDVVNNNAQLTINEEYANREYNIKNIDDMVQNFVNEMYSSHNSDIVVYLPEKVNVDVTTNYSNLIVEDNIVVDTINYETSSGQITLPRDMNLENLNIKSTGRINIDTNNLSGAKNVNIIAEEVYINNDEFTIDENNMPENLSIKTTNNEYNMDSVNIDTSAPIAKNLYIDTRSMVNIELPIVDYKFNFDINASRGIAFNTDNIDKYRNTSVERYFEEGNNQDESSLPKELKGVINNQLVNNENEYFVKINSSYTVFK